MMKNAISPMILHTHTHTHTQRNILSNIFLESNNNEQNLSSEFLKLEKAELFYFRSGQ